MAGENLLQRLAVLQGEHMGCGFEDRQKLEFLQGYGSGDGWGYLFVEQADRGLRAAVGGEHGDAIGFGGCDRVAGPAVKDRRWQEG